MLNAGVRWEVIGAGITILVVVLSLYGALIKRNYDHVTTLKQRLLGFEGDDTDVGFLQRTTDKLDSIGDKMDDHNRTIRKGLEENRRRVDDVERTLERVEYKVDAVSQVVEDEHDVMFRGENNSHETDGGRHQPRENTRDETPPSLRQSED